MDAALRRGPVLAPTRRLACEIAYAVHWRLPRAWRAFPTGPRRWRALHRLANSRLFAPRTAAAPIQVLGRAESAGLCFDHLWLAGLAQASWPPVARIRLPRQVAHAPLLVRGAHGGDRRVTEQKAPVLRQAGG